MQSSTHANIHTRRACLAAWMEVYVNIGNCENIYSWPKPLKKISLIIRSTFSQKCGEYMIRPIILSALSKIESSL